MVRPKRKQQHHHLKEAIKETARSQIARDGAAALSLRAIARELNITAPAIYNYFPNRDELVTTLIVDAYHSLAMALVEAKGINHQDHAAGIIVTANAYRSWALSHAEEYGLIFGSPIPGYHAPMEITSPAAGESMLVLIQILDATWQDGKLRLTEPSPALMKLLQPWVDKLAFTGPPAVIHLALACWTLIHGLVSLELFGHFAPTPAHVNVDSFFETEIQAIVERIVTT